MIILRFITLLLIVLQTLTYANEKVTLQLHWKYQFEFAGFIAAKEKGFYKDAGLDVTLKEYENGINIEEDVLNGVSEYGIYNSLSLVEYLKGKPIVLLSSYFKRAALVLVTSPEIRSPKDLVGKRVMASTKEDFILNFKPYFDGYGISIDDIDIVPNTYDLQPFKDGKVSAMTAFVSNELYALDKAGVKYNILDPSNDNLYVLQLELITSKKETLKHPERVKAFRDASIKGWDYALVHKEEMIDIIYNKYSKRVSKENLLYEAVSIEKLILPYTYNVGAVDRNFLNKQIKLFQKEYKVGSDKSVDNYIFEAKDESHKIIFTSQEAEYIKNAKAIPLCLEYDQFPIDGYENGKFIGIMADVFARISQKTSLKFTPVVSESVDDLAQKIENKECDMLSIYPTEDTRYKNLRPTKAISETYFALVSQLDKPFVVDASELRGKVVVTQLEACKEYLEALYPYLNIKVQNSKKRMIKMLLSKEAYAMVLLEEEAGYVVDKYGYGKLKINGFLSKEKPFKASIGVQKSEPILFSVIQKALAHISKEELLNIKNGWRITRYEKDPDYSLLIKIFIVIFIIFGVMLYYHRKLKNFNKKLEIIVNEKTKALTKINEYLEETVAQKVQELIQKDEILTVQSKQAVMGEMISMIAHQWRQPLNTITLNISNLQIKHMMGEKIDDALLTTTFDDITQTIVYLSETIDDFKTYFHPDKERTVVKIDEILNKAVNFILPRAEAADVKILITTESDITLSVYPNELIQVLLNILNNAIDAYADKTKENKRVILQAQKEDNNVKISISDRAGGIPKEILKQLFEPYFSTKGKNGTGLGLYMSQMIIEKQFEGEIKVETSGDATTFMIIIPIIDPV